MKCFFLTMGREWFGIDRWRMDKFMMLTRRFLRQVKTFAKL
jgi:ribosomal RNA-processing protein 1